MGKASENWLKIARYDLGAAENALKGGYYIRVPAKVPFIFTNGTSAQGNFTNILSENSIYTYGQIY